MIFKYKSRSKIRIVLQNSNFLGYIIYPLLPYFSVYFYYKNIKQAGTGMSRKFTFQSVSIHRKNFHVNTTTHSHFNVLRLLKTV